MKVVITGGAGFLGRRLALELIRRGELKGPHGSTEQIDRLILVDMTLPGLSHPRVDALVGDIASADFVRDMIDDETGSIFHLAAIVSGMAESDFDLGMRVNVDATRLLFEACRARRRRVRIVFTSSVAVYGGSLLDVALETTAVQPQTSYGTQKAIAELLLNDYTRRGFVDGRALRLPTITVRPGRPNAAASSFASGIIREPLNGEPAVCPVDDRARLWVMSPATVIDCLIAAHDLGPDALGANRVLNLPGLSVSVAEMVAALARVGGADVVSRIRWERDPGIARMVASWPAACDASRARALGFPTDETFDAIVRQYIHERSGSRTQ
jgi:nucleoside-diphosphate-sugar epimerase